LLCTGSLALAQDNNTGNSDDISALKAQIQNLQKQQLQYQKDQQKYQDRITEMEGEMKAMESKADSGSILKYPYPDGCRWQGSGRSAHA